MDPAALPTGAGQDGLDRGLQPGMGVADDQRNPFGSGGAGGIETALAQAPEELGPEIGRLAVADSHAQDLAAPEGGDADRDLDCLGDDMPLEADVEVGGVAVEVGEPGVVQRPGHEGVDDLVDVAADA